MSPRRKKKNDLFCSGPKGSFFVGARFQAWGRGGSAVSAGGSVWTIAGWALRGWAGGPRTAGRAYPTGSRGSYEASGRSAPLPAYPAGPPFLPRNGGKEGRGQAPWTPFFYAHSLPLVPLLRWEAQRGRYTGSYDALFLPLICGLSFLGKFFARKSYSKFLYPKKKESRSGYDERDRNSPTIVAMWHRAKSRTSGSEWP